MQAIAGFASILALLLAAAPGRASPAPSAWLPDYARLQFAGHTGILSLGTGYGSRTGFLEAEILYGYVPRAVAGVPIHTLALKSTLAPVRLRLGPSLTLHSVLAGCSVNAALGSRYFILPTGRFLDYYSPSGLNAWLYTGARVRRELPPGSSLDALSLVVEAGTLDDYLIARLNNGSIAWEDAVSLALAARIHF